MLCAAGKIRDSGPADAIGGEVEFLISRPSPCPSPRASLRGEGNKLLVADGFYKAVSTVAPRRWPIWAVHRGLNSHGYHPPVAPRPRRRNARGRGEFAAQESPIYSGALSA